MSLEDFLDFFKDDLNRPLRINITILIESFVMIDNLQGLFVISPESLLNALYIIIWTSTSLSSLEQTIQHYLLTAFQMQNKRYIHLLTHDFLPGIEVL